MVTRSLTLMSFDWASLLEYACMTNMMSISLTVQNLWKEVKVDDKHTNRTKTVCPRSFDLAA